MKDDMNLRPMTSLDRSEVAELIYVSLNYWYQARGRPAVFCGGPEVAGIFYDVYNALEPGCTVVAENPRTGRLMGSCFYHPRERHVSLGIMNVHPNYFGQGVARALLNHIIDYTDRNGYEALRLTQSAGNLDSFSLYTKAGFVPFRTYQDMLIHVPAEGMKAPAPGVERVRDATLADVPAMAALEMELSGIARERDYRYCIANQLGMWHVSVYQNQSEEIEGFLISSKHPASSRLGPCVARSEPQALALISSGLDRYRGGATVVLAPADCKQLVQQMYAWGARNCEICLGQVRGKCKPIQGVNIPAFLPETG
jgi:GNAT superfamily N-acetyltransferase